MFYHICSSPGVRGWAQWASDALAGNTDTQEAFMPGNVPVLLRGFNVTELIGSRSTVPAWARLVGTDGLRGSPPEETNVRSVTRPWIPPNSPSKGH